MKLIVFSFFLLIALSTISIAQEPMFYKNDKVLNVGLGIGSFSYMGKGYTTLMPPLSVSYEQGILDEIIDKGSIGVGGYVGFSSYRWTEPFWTSSFTNLVIGARGSFHYPFLENLDTYAGMMIGYEFLTWKQPWAGKGHYSGSSGLWTLYIGGRYYLNEQISAMAEIGYGITFITIGVGIKLN